uniref:Putative secreted protein n=1 Tax=Ixodes ricinus TaxID=34613 RepID=A0A6B0UL01_IXORI
MKVARSLARLLAVSLLLVLLGHNAVVLEERTHPFGPGIFELRPSSTGDRLVGHANIFGGPTTKSAGKVVHFFGHGLVRVLRCLHLDAGRPHGQCVHAAWTVKAALTPVFLYPGFR